MPLSSLKAPLHSKSEAKLHRGTTANYPLIVRRFRFAEFCTEPSVFCPLIARCDEFGAQIKAHAVVYSMFYSGSFPCDASVRKELQDELGWNDAVAEKGVVVGGWGVLLFEMPHLLVDKVDAEKVAAGTWMPGVWCRAVAASGLISCSGFSRRILECTRHSTFRSASSLLLPCHSALHNPQ